MDLEASRSTAPAMIALAAWMLLSLVLVNDPRIIELDQKLFLEINQHFIPGIAALVMFGVSELGSVIVPLSIFVVMWMVGRKDIAVAILLAFALYGLIGLGLKALVMRPRPLEVLMDIDHLVPLPGGFVYGHSFPSGHTAGVFSILGVLIMKARRWAPPVAALAVIVGFLRVLLGSHFPFDVIAGAGLGLFVGILFGSLRYGELISRMDAVIERRILKKGRGHQPG